MNLIHNVRKNGAFFLLLTCFTGSAFFTVRGEEKSVVIEEQPVQKLIVLLNKCFFDFNDKTSFQGFITKMIELLEDKEYAAAVTKEFPRLDIPKIIVVLKKVQFKTSYYLIGFHLKPFLKKLPAEFLQKLPADLQDTKKVENGLSRRLAIK